MVDRIPLEDARVVWNGTELHGIQELMVMRVGPEGLSRSVYEKYPFDSGNSEPGWIEEFGPADVFEDLNDLWGWSSIESLKMALIEFEKIGFRVTLREIDEAQTAEVGDGT